MSGRKIINALQDAVAGNHARETIKFVGSGQTFQKEPTAQLRWSKAGVLQQAWAVTEFSGGSPIAMTHEWRDIPREPQS